MSATAAGKSYPMSRSDSVSRAADGVISADFQAVIRHLPVLRQASRPGSHTTEDKSCKPSGRFMVSCSCRCRCSASAEAMVLSVRTSYDAKESDLRIATLCDKLYTTTPRRAAP